MINISDWEIFHQLSDLSIMIKLIYSLFTCHLFLSSLCSFCLLSAVRKLILLPSSFHPDFLQTLLGPGFLNEPSPPLLTVCQPKEPPSSIHCSQNISEYGTAKDVEQHAEAVIRWNESIVELDQVIWDMMKSQPNGTLHPAFREVPLNSVIMAVQKDDSNNKIGRKKQMTSLSSVERWSSTLDVLYLQLKLRKETNLDESNKFSSLEIYEPSVYHQASRINDGISETQNPIEEDNQFEEDDQFEDNEDWASPQFSNLDKIPEIPSFRNEEVASPLSWVTLGHTHRRDVYQMALESISLKDVRQI